MPQSLARIWLHFTFSTERRRAFLQNEGHDGNRQEDGDHHERCPGGDEVFMLGPGLQKLGQIVHAQLPEKARKMGDQPFADHLQADKAEHGREPIVQKPEHLDHPGQEEVECPQAEDGEDIRGEDDERIPRDAKNRRHAIHGNAVLVLHRNLEEAEDHGEDKDVVHRKGPFDQVARQKLQSHGRTPPPPDAGVEDQGQPAPEGREPPDSRSVGVRS